MLVKLNAEGFQRSGGQVLTCSVQGQMKMICQSQNGNLFNQNIHFFISIFKAKNYCKRN